MDIIIGIVVFLIAINVLSAVGSGLSEWFTVHRLRSAAARSARLRAPRSKPTP